MSQQVALFVALVLVLGGRCWAEPPPDASVPERVRAEEEGKEAEVQAAPGGGDMLILGPEFRYITRGSLDGQGRVKVGCAHDGDAGEAGAVEEAK